MSFNEKYTACWRNENQSIIYYDTQRCGGVVNELHGGASAVRSSRKIQNTGYPATCRSQWHSYRVGAATSAADMTSMSQCIRPHALKCRLVAVPCRFDRLETRINPALSVGIGNPHSAAHDSKRCQRVGRVVIARRRGAV
jgi:hypothetical protein